MPATTYTPTKRNLAHAAAKTFRASLADAVRAGITAGALTEAEIAEAAGALEGEVVRVNSATALDLEDALHVAQNLDAAGYTAFRNAVHDAVDAAAPEGWVAPA